MKQIKLFIQFIVLFSLQLSYSNGKISDRRLCGDEKCSTIVSLATTTVRYTAGDTYMLSFQPNKPVNVFSKSAGSNPDVWGVEISGRRGYVPKKLLIEQKVIKGDLQFEVDTELVEDIRKAELEAQRRKDAEAVPEQVALPAVVNEKIIPVVNVSDESPNSIETNTSSAEVSEQSEGDESEDEDAKDYEDDEDKSVDDGDNSPSVASQGEISSEHILNQNEQATSAENEQTDSSSLPEEALYEGKTPVDEPLFEKKNAYVTTDNQQHSPIDAPILLELATTNADVVLQDKSVVYNATLDPRNNNPAPEIVSQPETKDIVQENASENVDIVAPLFDSETHHSEDATAVDEPELDEAKTPESNTIDKQPELEASSEIPAEEIAEQQETQSAPQEPVQSTDESITSSSEDINADVASTVGGTTQTDSNNSELVQPQAKETVVQANNVPIENIPVSETVTDTTINAVNTSTEPLNPIKPATSVPPLQNESNEQQDNSIDTLSLQTTATPVELQQSIPNEPEQATVDTESNELNDTNTNDLNTESAIPVPPTPAPTPDPHQKYISPNEGNIPHVHTIADFHQHHHGDGHGHAHGAAGHGHFHGQHNHHHSHQSGEKPHEHHHGHIHSPPTMYPALVADRVRAESVLAASAEPKNIDNNGNTVLDLNQKPTEQFAQPAIADKVDPLLNSGNGIDESLFRDNTSPITPEPVSNWIDDTVATVKNFVEVFLPHTKSDNKPDKDQFSAKKSELNDYNGHCEKMTPGSCPKLRSNLRNPGYGKKSPAGSMFHDIIDDFIQMNNQADLVVYLVVTAVTVLIFTLGYYYITYNRKENGLVSKLNILEKKLMTSEKECCLLKNDLFDTRSKLESIEDNSFGSNDMVIALKQQLEESEKRNEGLHQQIATLDKELESATEAGLELNNMISELLNSKNGNDSIITSVEELQRQLNEQETATMSINNLLAEKSRENSELHIQLNEKCSQYEIEIEELLKNIDVLRNEKEEAEQQLNDKLQDIENDLRHSLDKTTSELDKLKKEYADLKAHSDSIQSKLQISDARAQALDESINKLRRADGKELIDFNAVMEITDLKTQVLALRKDRETLKDKLDGEMDARHLLEDHVKIVNGEVAVLRQGFNQSEKDKIEAQTRLEVLSGYFKEKETQLQKELSIKEAIAMKQQGESTSTVERMKSLQQEIHELKSQNDALRAEIEAQSAAHKAQINAAEARAHEFWLNSKQNERRFEEVRSEATSLRRKLTSLATNNSTGHVENNVHNRPSNIDGLLPNDVNAPSPIHLESPGSPIMGLPPPPSFLPPFMGPPPINLPFMPPPPLLPMPPGEMRPPPLGRLMSPPPPNNRYSPNSYIDDRDRYGGRYSPEERYSDMRSQYETETDFSPPRSPEARPVYRDQRNSGYKAYSPATSPPPPSNRKSSSKGGFSSGSIDSTSSRKNRGSRI